MEYPEMQSAFEVFSAKLNKKKKRDTNSKTSPGKSTQVSSLRHKVSKVKAMHEENSAGLGQIDNGKVIRRKSKIKRDTSLTNGIPDQQINGFAHVNLVKKKRKSETSGNELVKHLDVIEGETVTKKKKKKVALKTNLSVASKSVDDYSEEDSVIFMPNDNVKNGNNLIYISPEIDENQVVSNASFSSNATTPVLKVKKNSVMKKQKKGKKGLKNKKGGDDFGKNSNVAAEKCTGSVKDGEELFAWLIDPITPEDFFRDSWEQRPIMIKREQPDFYQSLLSTSSIHKMLELDNVQFTKNVDVTTYQNGKRETHNPDGRAFPAVVWSHYNAGCSVRLLNPHAFIPKMHLLNATLQEYFGCLVGANAYLTPPKSQGFAPHYDDIEAFVLQLEGQKEWKLYAPRTEQELLPRFSSNNLTDEMLGEPIMEVVLNPGDLLYFPRGTIHQARTLATHSLHVTLSCYQRNTWGDLLEKAIPVALRYALEENVEYRRGLPRDYLRYMGSVHSDRDLPEREAFVERLHSLVDNLFQHLPVDAAVDQLGKQFMHDALPPVLTSGEKQCTVFGDGLKMMENGKLSNQAELELNTRVKLLRALMLRLVVEDEDVVKVYHYVDNALEYHGSEPQFLELPVEAAPAIELLIHTYPKFVPISILPLASDQDKVKLAGELWEKGLLMTDGPLNTVFSE